MAYAVDYFEFCDMFKSTVYVVIPVYNEVPTVVLSVVQSLQEEGYKNICIVDDGSIPPVSNAIASECYVTLLRHPINRGYGAALQTGIDYVFAYTNADVVITFDADGQHQARDVGSFVDVIINDGYDVVLGSRFLGSAKNISIFRKVVLRCAILFTTMTSGILLTDAHNGFRGLSRKAMRVMRMRARGMEYSTEIIDEIRRNRLRYKEVPVEITYSEYAAHKGQKTLNFVALGLKIISRKLFK